MLTLDKILNDRPEISKKVYEKYPVTNHEKRCMIEKSKMECKRFELAKKLYEHCEV